MTGSIETHCSAGSNMRQRGGTCGRGSHCVLEMVIGLPCLHITAQSREQCLIGNGSTVTVSQPNLLKKMAFQAEAFWDRRTGIVRK